MNAQPDDSDQIAPSDQVSNSKASRSAERNFSPVWRRWFCAGLSLSPFFQRSPIGSEFGALLVPPTWLGV